MSIEEVNKNTIPRTADEIEYVSFSDEKRLLHTLTESLYDSAIKDKNEAAVTINHENNRLGTPDLSIEEQQKKTEQCANDAIVATDQNYIVEGWNIAAEQIFGWSSNEAIGKNIDEFLKTQFVGPTREAAYERLEKQGYSEAEVIFTTKDDSAVNMICTVSILKDKDGNYKGTVGIMHNITKQRRTEHLSNVMKHIRMLIHSTLDFDELMNGIIEEATKGFGCETATISLCKEDEWVISYVYGLSKGTVGISMDDGQEAHAVLAILQRKPIVVMDTYNDNRVNAEHMKKQGIRSVMVIPLLAEDQVIGVMCFNFHKKIFNFCDSDIEFAQNLATSISMALKNVKLYETIKAELATRKKLEGILENQNRQLEAIIDNMQEALFIFDNTGKPILVNKVGRNLVLSDVDSSYKKCEYYYLDGIKLPLEETPSYKVKCGIIIENQILKLRVGLKDSYVSISGTPVFDCNNKLLYGIICSRDITDYVKSEQSLKESQLKQLAAEKEKNEALEKVIDMKDEFLSMTSHEFKTPLTVINSAIQVLELIYKDELSERVMYYIKKIKQNAFRQLRLVNNLLDITRISAEQIKMQKANIDIIFLSKAIINSVSVYSEQKGIVIRLDSLLSKKIISIDEEKYERILLNLISNAIKFSPQNGLITIKIVQSIINNQSKVLIEVIDQGVGIPEEKKSLIFERFGQVDSSLSRQAEGTGIGLYLVKKFVEAHGGEVSVSSEIGKGSKFTITLNDTVEEKAEVLRRLPELTNSRLIQAVEIEFSDIYF